MEDIWPSDNEWPTTESEKKPGAYRTDQPGLVTFNK